MAQEKKNAVPYSPMYNTTGWASVGALDRTNGSWPQQQKASLPL
ncbi:hypothetical protein THARTR1_04177 [Trichoderma harzianum]|uniref:Uncharacterized protein n=1 Tax=Trichoderma harzianum TaxID=5544 RepID=A0A2K0UD02_TRIHA|nr:hypothetical protein THARTR1_04177 [Trichoderma harzianum]